MGGQEAALPFLRVWSEIRPCPAPGAAHRRCGIVTHARVWASGSAAHYCAVLVLRRARDTRVVPHFQAGLSGEIEAQLCMPQRRTVAFSSERKITLSTTRPMMMTVNNPANTAAVSS